MIEEIIDFAFREDIGEGDHSSLACVPENAQGKAQLIIKEVGVLAGVELAERIFHRYDPDLELTLFKKDGDQVYPGDIVLEVRGASRSILATERLVLNFMQRMSGIASLTHRMVALIADLPTSLLDTRKTTPGIRLMEKWAVRIGGGKNHRFALYDMIMLKDNHIDYAGGIQKAIESTHQYLRTHKKDLKIEIEVRNLDELHEVLENPKVDRIMLDNFSISDIQVAMTLIPDGIEVEASGGITEETLRTYAATGVHFISMGALTHSYKSMDMSLKAFF